MIRFQETIFDQPQCTSILSSEISRAWNAEMKIRHQRLVVSLDFCRHSEMYRDPFVFTPWGWLYFTDNGGRFVYQSMSDPCTFGCSLCTHQSFQFSWAQCWLPLYHQSPGVFQSVCSECWKNELYAAKSEGKYVQTFQRYSVAQVFQSHCEAGDGCKQACSNNFSDSEKRWLRSFNGERGLSLQQKSSNLSSTDLPRFVLNHWGILYLPWARLLSLVSGFLWALLFL